ncbi:MAG: hypothetical protein GEV11_24825 [Streptosporangiales bacterium]|nr:hypothetical protein [Streptosporangiales bacterium]
MSRVVRLLRYALALMVAWVLWAVVFVVPIPMLPRAIEVQAGDATIRPVMGTLAVAGFVLFTYLAIRSAARRRLPRPARLTTRTRGLAGTRTP